jgi:hypothetical protein
MGNSCCQDNNVKKDISESIENNFALKTLSNEFYETDYPNDPALIKAIEDIKHNESSHRSTQPSPLFWRTID